MHNKYFWWQPFTFSSAPSSLINQTPEETEANSSGSVGKYLRKSITLFTKIKSEEVEIGLGFETPLHWGLWQPPTLHWLGSLCAGRAQSADFRKLQKYVAGLYFPRAAQLHESLVLKAMKCLSTDSCFPSVAVEQLIHQQRALSLHIDGQKDGEILEEVGWGRVRCAISFAISFSGKGDADRAQQDHEYQMIPLVRLLGFLIRGCDHRLLSEPLQSPSGYRLWCSPKYCISRRRGRGHRFLPHHGAAVL